MFTSFNLFRTIAAVLASRTTMMMMMMMIIIIFKECEGFSHTVFMNVRGVLHDPFAANHDVICNTSFKPSPTLSEQQFNNHQFLNKSTRIIQTNYTKPSKKKEATTVFNKTKTISSMILFAKMIHHYYHDKNTSIKQTFSDKSSLSPTSRVTTRTQIHLSRLSDTSTYEFQRREHIEIVSGDGAGIYDQVGLHDKPYLEIDNIEKIDDIFVQEQFEKGDMAFSKAELDRFITSPGREEIFINESTYRNDVGSYNRKNDNDKTLQKATMVNNQNLSSSQQQVQMKKEKIIQEYSKSSNVGERAFAILLELNMVVLNPDPNDPDYDHSMDDDICC